MGWGNRDAKPTGYWFCWQEGMKGPSPRFKANTEGEAKEKYKQKYGFYPDFCEQELD